MKTSTFAAEHLDDAGLAIGIVTDQNKIADRRKLLACGRFMVKQPGQLGRTFAELAHDLVTLAVQLGNSYRDQLPVICDVKTVSVIL